MPLTYAIIIFNKSFSIGIFYFSFNNKIGFNIIPKELGIYPLLLMVYIIISMIICIYYGESICLGVFRYRSISYCTIIIVFFITSLCNIFSILFPSEENLNKTMDICCDNDTYSNKCDFMEEYGCESSDIALKEIMKIFFSSMCMFVVNGIMFVSLLVYI